MTSKEMEARSGVARANIRYYEAEGLLTPARRKNGYRDYSEADLELLEKIKLLRRLGVSVEELKALRSGSASLATVLDRRLAELQGERASQERVETVCGALRRSGETFSTLNAARYLSDLDAPALPRPQAETWWAESPTAPLPAADTLPPAPGLGRRFFARFLDESLMLCLLLTLLALLGQNPALVNGTLMGILVQIALLTLEPLLIRLLGTTPGKALLGMRLARPDGSRLSYGEAFTRHFRMLWHALGLGIPIVSLVQPIRCLRRAYREEPQPWDEEVAYTAKPFQSWRAILWLLVGAAALAVGETANSASQLPPNRGDLTVAEFAENFNHQARYLGMEFSYELDEQGNRRERPQDPNTIVFSATGDWQEGPAFHYTVEDGRLTAVTLTCRAENTAEWLSAPLNTMAAAVAAFAWAPEDTPFWSFQRTPLLEDLNQWWDKGFQQRLESVEVSIQTENRNFQVAQGWHMLIPEDETENYFSCTFTMFLVK